MEKVGIYKNQEEIKRGKDDPISPFLSPTKTKLNVHVFISFIH